MLIEFSLSNWRSFAAEQGLSLIASKLKDEPAGRVLSTRKPHELDVLSTAIILGKNGSGKSGLVQAMAFIRRFVRVSSSSSQEGDEISFKPHLLDPAFRDKDCQIGIVFSVQHKVYQFRFSFNKTRVTAESLFIADRTRRFRRLYERSFNKKTEKDVYRTSEELKGEKSMWQASTRANALFLSTAVQLNAETLREPFDWLTRSLRSIDASTETSTGFSARQCMQPENKEKILSFMKRLDIDLTDIQIEEEDVDDEALKVAFNTEFFEKNIKKRLRGALKTRFIHEDAAGSDIALDLAEESTGTRSLFGLVGPLFDTLANGYCLVIDEINTSIHPNVLKVIVDTFSNPEVNVKRAQLIFTSHDTSLLREGYFRRDQVWFVNKSKHGASSFVPLSDYSPRKGEALEKGYLDGRYGGVPAIGPEINFSSDAVAFDVK